MFPAEPWVGLLMVVQQAPPLPPSLVLPRCPPAPSTRMTLPWSSALAQVCLQESARPSYGEPPSS